MFEIVQNYVGLACSIAAMILAIVTAVLKAKGSKKTGVFDAIKWALKALPGFITFSETVNEGADGATKKAFVMDQITAQFAVMGVTIDESVLSEISATIDSIIATTKRVHAEKGVTSNAGDSVHDIGTVTGLRIVS